MSEKNYREQMFNGILKVLETTGKGDQPYDDTQKTIDILEILELTLASTLIAIAPDKDSVRDACDEAAFHIKKIAINLYEQEQTELTELAPRADLPPADATTSNSRPKMQAPAPANKKLSATTLQTKSDLMRTHQAVKAR
jgi:hypothetical protein